MGQWEGRGRGGRGELWREKTGGTDAGGAVGMSQGFQVELETQPEGQGQPRRVAPPKGGWFLRTWSRACRVPGFAPGLLNPHPAVAPATCICSKSRRPHPEAHSWSKV